MHVSPRPKSGSKHSGRQWAVTVVYNNRRKNWNSPLRGQGGRAEQPPLIRLASSRQSGEEDDDIHVVVVSVVVAVVSVVVAVVAIVSVRRCGRRKKGCSRRRLASWRSVWTDFELEPLAVDSLSARSPSAVFCICHGR